MTDVDSPPELLQWRRDLGAADARLVMIAAQPVSRGGAVRFRLLGPVDLVVGREVVDVGSAKQRCVLAALLWRPGAAVPVETLIDRVWGDEPPAQAHNSLYSYIARLRALMNGTSPGGSLTRDSQGYRLEVDPERVDLARYQRLVRQARTATSAQERLAAFDQALALWRAEPLSGVPGPWAHRARDGLDLQHGGVLAEWARTAIDQGRAEAVVDRLTQARDRYPFAESLVEQLMIALCRTDGVECALKVFREFRERLSDELGLEPARRLRDLEVRALRADPALVGTPEGHPRRSPGPAAPVRYVRRDQVHLAYQVVGPERPGRPDIVVVPGLLSHLDLWWEDPQTAGFFHRLAALGRLIMFDKRGTGLSDRTMGDDSPEGQAGDVLAIMEACGSRRAVLFAISEGVPVSIACAAAHPDRVAGLVLAGGAARWTPDADYPCGDRFERAMTSLENTARHTWGQGDTIEWYCRHLADSRRARELVGRRERMSVSPNDFIRMLRLIPDIDVRDALPDVRVPTVVLQRLDDRLSHPFYGRYLAERIPGARYVEMPGDHIIWLGETDPVITELAQLLATVT
ncbi:alpha/beta fold hydrolase [Spirillospora sp. NPDC048819]|uniref:alpha/beta fold hydrolase n=1 Tax=Spirillospora sp. NPDC048819 TaxID=3155268 RepID=UPI0033CB1239